MADHTDLLVIGAGPYAYSAAAYARDQGIATRIVGRPMAFWRDQMPADMYLRSGPDWHLDASGEDTFEAFFEDRGLDPADHDPIPIGVFLDHTDWFAERKGLRGRGAAWWTELTRPDGTFVARMEDGDTITADQGAGRARHRATTPRLPDWADAVPAGASVAHQRAGPLRRPGRCPGGDRRRPAERLRVGGPAVRPRRRAGRRRAPPRHPGVRQGELGVRGRLRRADAGDPRLVASPAGRRAGRDRVEVLAGRAGSRSSTGWCRGSTPTVVHRHPRCEVVSVDAASGDAVRLTLSDGETLDADHVVFASGYRADLARVPYLAGVLDRISVTDGFPDLSEGFETSLPGLYVVGFSATRDFGPFYGFTKGCPSAARIVVDGDAPLATTSEIVPSRPGTTASLSRCVSECPRCAELAVRAPSTPCPSSARRLRRFLAAAATPASGSRRGPSPSPAACAPRRRMYRMPLVALVEPADHRGPGHAASAADCDPSSAPSRIADGARAPRHQDQRRDDPEVAERNIRRRPSPPSPRPAPPVGGPRAHRVAAGAPGPAPGHPRHGSILAWISWILRGGRTTHPRSRKCFFSSPRMVGTATATSPARGSGRNRGRRGSERRRPPGPDPLPRSLGGRSAPRRCWRRPC